MLPYERSVSSFISTSTSSSGGSTGATGPGGGATGDTGAAGSTGVGIVGATGVQGNSITGATGADSIVPGPTGAQGNSITGSTGADSIVPGPTGADSTVPGPTGVQGNSITGATGADSTVPGPTGVQGNSIIGATGADSTVPGPTGVGTVGATGADSTVPGPTGADSTVPGPTGIQGNSITGSTGADSIVPGPTGVGTVGATGPLVSGTEGQTLRNNSGTWEATSSLLTNSDGTLTSAAAPTDPNHIIKLSQMSTHNGTFVEAFNAVVTSNGTVITMSLQSKAAGDLTMQFSDGYTTLDCTPACTIELTAGTTTVPKTNYIYIPESTKVLTKSTTEWPSAEHIKVAFFFVQTAAYVQADGALINQNWNDEYADSNNQGHITHIGQWIRRQGAVWFSGVAPAGTSEYLTIVSGSPDNVYFKCGGGVISQMHSHSYASKDMSSGDDMHVINDSTTAYNAITDINTVLTDSAGASMSGRYFNLVFAGVANKGGEYTPLLCLLPSGSYSNLSDAEKDVETYTTYTLPREFSHDSSTGFLIARVTLKHSTAGGGTWTVQSTTDLRGSNGITAGGGGGVGAQGATGADGATGIGTVGATGADSTVPGPTGADSIIPGPTGIQGNSITGATGSDGSDGATGIGIVGATGSDGSDGATGVGTVGATGPSGSGSSLIALRMAPEFRCDWDPGQLVGLSDGDPIVEFRDSGIDGKHMVQATSTKRATYQTNELNGHPIARFDGDDYYAIPDSFLHTRGTVVLICKQASVGGDYVFDYNEDNVHVALLLSSTSNPGFALGFTHWANYYSDPCEWHIYVISWLDDGFTALMVDGVEQDNTVNFQMQTVTTAGRIFGANRTGVSQFNGDVAQFVYLASECTTADRYAISEYFANKFDLPLMTTTVQSLGGLGMWLDADQLTGLDDGDPVPSWTDMNGSHHCTQSNATYQPTYQTNEANGHPIVRFDGVDDYMTIPSIFDIAHDGDTEGTWVFVVKHTGTSQDRILEYSNASGDTYISIQQDPTSTGQTVWWNDSVNGWETIVTSTSDSSYSILVVTWQVNSTFSFWIDGALEGSLDINDGVYGGSDTATLGSVGSGSLAWGGDMAEVIYYAKHYSRTDLDDVMNYLATKYDITIT